MAPADHIVLHRCVKSHLRLYWSLAGQAQQQSLQEQPQQSTNSHPVAPLTIQPDINLDQNTKILTLGQGSASIFGQKYTLPALPFKLPATPALNSLQAIYPRESPALLPRPNAGCLSASFAQASSNELLLVLHAYIRCSPVDPHPLTVLMGFADMECMLLKDAP